MTMIRLDCYFCGTEFDKRRAEFDRQVREGRDLTYFFCSQSCAAYQAASQRPQGLYRASLSRWARRSYKGAWMCVDCGLESMGLDIHHIDRDKTNNASDNLMALCRSCHVTRHNFARETGRGRKSVDYAELATATV